MVYGDVRGKDDVLVRIHDQVLPTIRADGGHKVVHT